MLSAVTKDIEFITIKLTIYYNFKKIREPILKKKNSVYLLRKNIKIKRLSLKLNYIKLELYSIKEVLETITYKFKLFDEIRIYLVFYISLLESVSRNIK